MPETPPVAVFRPAKTPGVYITEPYSPEPLVRLHEALRALEARVEAAAREAMADPALRAAPPEGRVAVRMLALPAETGTASDRPFSPVDPLPPPPPPLAPLFVVWADHEDHRVAVACIGAVLASVAKYPLLPWREDPGFLRVDRVDLELADALAIRSAAGLAAAPFALLQLRGVTFPGPQRRPERVFHDPENADMALHPTRQVEETLRSGLKAFAFHPNAPDTWAAVKGMALGVLHDFWRDRYFARLPAEEAYAVSCGLGETMTAEDLLNGYLRLMCNVWDETSLDYLTLTFELQMPR